MVLPYLGNDADKLDNDPYWALGRAAGRGDLEALKTLVQQRRSGPNESDLTSDLHLPLRMAAKNCNLATVSYLLSEGAVITDEAIRSAASPLSDTETDAIPIFDAFRKHGWDVNTKPSRGEHVLFGIISSEPLTRYILAAGLSLQTMTSRSPGLTPITHAAYRSSPVVVSLLLSHGAQLTPRVLQNAIRGHDDDDDAAFEMFDYLLAQDPKLASKVNEIDPLHHPGRTRRERQLLDFGAPLHWAVWSGRKARIEFLIRKGADVGVKSLRKRQTARDWARILGNKGCEEILEGLEAGQSCVARR